MKKDTCRKKCKSSRKVTGGWCAATGGDYWCDVLANGWTDDPFGDGNAAWTFSSAEEAKGAYRQANKMYGERADRYKAALARLGRSADTDGC
jgi:hypothetical protein